MISQRHFEIMKEHYSKIVNEVYPILESEKCEIAIEYCENERQSLLYW